MRDPNRRARLSKVCRTIVWMLAGFGLVVIVEGVSKGGLRHRLLAAFIGAGFLLPLGVPWLLGRKWDSIRVKVLLLVGSTAVSLLALEAGIRLIRPSSFQHPEIMEHPVRGFSMRPNRGGMDARGFRNVEALERADIVCIGDSQTYGSSVRLSETFPVALGERFGRSVYNMSLGGYGPVQYLALTKTAIELRPKAIVVGFYFGNDLVNAHTAIGIPHWARLQDPKRTYERPLGASPHTPEPNLAMNVLALLKHSSKLVRYLHSEVSFRMKQSRYLADTYWREPGAPRYDGGNIQTLFTPKLRLGPLQLSSGQVRDGLRITEQCLIEMNALCDRAGVRMVLLLLHTKEFYYHRFLTARGDAAAGSLAELAAAEVTMTTRIKGIAERLGAGLIDPKQKVLEALREDRALWPPNSDGHFTAAGCALVAEVIHEQLLKICPELATNTSPVNNR